MTVEMNAAEEIPTPESVLSAQERWVREHTTQLDRLLKSTVLALAGAAPTVAGQIAALGAAGYDFACRFWIGGILSLLSIIPLIGYVPGFAKVARNIRLLDLELGEIERMLPTLQSSPEALATLQTVIRRYSAKISKAPGNLKIVARLRAIAEYGAAEFAAAPRDGVAQTDPVVG